MKPSKKKQCLSDSRYMKSKNQTEHERNEYRKMFHSALKIILPFSTTSERCGCPVGNIFRPPFISCILPINQDTKLQMVVGSNLQHLDGEHLIIHEECVVEVNVPKTFCILFQRDRTIHGGGYSDDLNLRMFGVFGPHNVFGSIENKNYSSMVKKCVGNNCCDCMRLRQYKSLNNGKMVPPSKDLKKVKVLECLNDYELMNHGFCIVKVSKKAPVSLLNQGMKVGNEMTQGIKFHSIGQEETTSCGGTRDILDIGSQLSSEALLQKKLHGMLDDYLDVCQQNICLFLKEKYVAAFEQKGRTLLRSKGPIQNQILHLDGKPDCTCT